MSAFYSTRHVRFALTAHIKFPRLPSSIREASPSFSSLFCRRRRWLFYRLALATVAPDFMATITNTQALVGMLVDRHPTPSQAAAPLRLLDLQDPLIQAHRVISPNHPLLLDRKDQLQILP